MHKKSDNAEDNDKSEFYFVNYREKEHPASWICRPILKELKSKYKNGLSERRNEKLYKLERVASFTRANNSYPNVINSKQSLPSSSNQNPMMDFQVNNVLNNDLTTLFNDFVKKFISRISVELNHLKKKIHNIGSN